MNEPRNDDSRLANLKTSLGGWIERGLLLAIGAILVGAWCLVLLRSLSDWHPFFELFTHTSFHVWLTVTGAFFFSLAATLVRRNESEIAKRWLRRTLFLAIPFLFLFWVTTPWRLLPLIGAAPASSSSSSIKVLSWNVWMMNSDIDQLSEFIQRESPDTVFLFEVSRKLERLLEERFQDYPVRLLQGEHNSAGFAVLSKMPNTEVSTWVPGDAGLPAIELISKDENGVKQLAVLGMHTYSPNLGEFARTELRNRQLHDLAQWASRQDQAAVIIGDLNITPWSPPFWRLLEIGGLCDSALYRGYQATWPVPFRWLAIPIDHALVNHQVRVIDRRTLRDSTRSDHQPIVIEFETR